MNNSNTVDWDEPPWKDVNDAVTLEILKVRTAQKVFPTVVLDSNPTEIPNDVIDFTDLSIKEGQTKQFVEIYHEFPLTATQFGREAELKTCRTLSRMVAKAIAIAEDMILFQGKTANLPANVTADLRESAGDGLLGEASDAIEVKLSNAKPGVLYGENTFSAVSKGIALLTAKAQAPNFALFLPFEAYADAFAPPSDQSLVTTAERIRPLVEGGFIVTVALPPERGLLVALGGDPTSIHVGREATTEDVRKDGSKYFFRVVERVQFVARDPRAFVLLEFQQPSSTVSVGPTP